MLKNKNILYITLAVIFLTACTRELNLTHDVRTIYENKLEKHLICTQETDIGYKDVSVLSCDTASIHFIKHTSIETYPGTLGTFHYIEFYKDADLNDLLELPAFLDARTPAFIS